VHGDPRLDNLMFDAGAVRAPIVLLDWQNVSRGAPTSDVAYFLAQSLTVADLRAHGDDLLAGYHAELAGHGITDFPLDELSEALRQALPVSFAVAASLAVLADLTDPRVHELAVGMGERALAAADQMGLLDELRLP
jgi:aminoglycoside phosphotransferase (APT) family kinase protein